MKNNINIKNHCLIGDFNIDILNDSVHDNNSEQRYYITVTSQEFLNNLLEYEYILFFLGITRPSQNKVGGTCIDNMYLRRSYTYRPFCPKLPKKMIKNIIIIKLFKYIVNITYFE